MTEGSWIGYNELAWLETIISPPEQGGGAVERYCSIIEAHSAIPVKTILHLASGAGIDDYTFKNHYRVVGVDISPGMLEVARGLNPEVEYYQGDMRSWRLDKLFDCVVIPDSIGYMLTVQDLCQVLRTADCHLKEGGVLLVIAHTREEFRENNFVYSGSKGNTRVTVFENNALPHPGAACYEATMIYLVRTDRELQVFTDRHTIGLFPGAFWRQTLEEMGCSVKEERMDHLYDAFLMEDGQYPLTAYAARKEPSPRGKCPAK